VFPWARFQSNNGAVKLHTLLDLRGSIPTFIEISDGKRSDVSVLDEMPPEAGAFYVMDRGYLDFARLHAFHRAGAFFVSRTKADILMHRCHSRPVDKTTGLRSDQTVFLTSAVSRRHYPDPLRRIRFRDVDKQRSLGFLTNSFDLPALTITQLYQSRWKVELFFKWIKQHLRIKAFYGTSENAVKTQIWIAIAIYVLVAILKKRLALDATLYQILQVLSVTLFEKTPILRAFDDVRAQLEPTPSSNQLNLIDF
jgi:IS4 transposase